MEHLAILSRGVFSNDVKIIACLTHPITFKVGLVILLVVQMRKERFKMFM